MTRNIRLQCARAHVLLHRIDVAQQIEAVANNGGAAVACNEDVGDEAIPVRVYGAAQLGERFAIGMVRAPGIKQAVVQDAQTRFGVGNGRSNRFRPREKRRFASVFDRAIPIVTGTPVAD